MKTRLGIVCTGVDEEELDSRALPISLRKAGLRSLREAYGKDARIRHNIVSLINKVRRDLGITSRNDDS